MVKIIRFFCIVGILALLALFIGFTEFEQEKKPMKKLTETEVLEEAAEVNLKAEIDEPKTSISSFIFNLL